MDVCVCVYYVLLLSWSKQRPCDELITRPRSPIVCVKKDYETEEEARVQKGVAIDE
jgi:hypothetical protein